MTVASAMSGTNGVSERRKDRKESDTADAKRHVVSWAQIKSTPAISAYPALARTKLRSPQSR